MSAFLLISKWRSLQRLIWSIHGFDDLGRAEVFLRSGVILPVDVPAGNRGLSREAFFQRLVTRMVMPKIPLEPSKKKYSHE